MPDPTQPPQQILVTGSDGNVESFIDVDKLQSDATRLMYQLAVTAGDDEATDEVSKRWVTAHDPDYFGFLAAAALSLMTRCILGPILEVTDEMGVNLRDGLDSAANNAESTLGDN
ncbi:hypothetical protein [Gordonia otitidis]|uniref:Uncharacterized protein n=1 Tax=Gordonia otitidis (strain DSM 44809 / CCUG 52243 / JCM 12355 / NBRC 100426 / IFM 10032) TaxID=1108044 RepID=H5TTQ6_GORO1|nr:hypothetical protein [Gordonia otitidis]GAB36864.1 hypothetical protein GOOTI_241_00190 [Gordonia otitidis NBRC 100426]